MKQNRLMYLLGDIDERFAEAAEFPKKRSVIRPILRYGSIAVCFCLLATAGLGIHHSINTHIVPISPSTSEISATENSTASDVQKQQILLSAFASTITKDHDSDAYGEDELHHVDVILQGNRLYDQIPESEYAFYGINGTLQESDFGESLGTITEIGPHSEDVLSTPCSQEPTLAGCEVFYYKPVNCEAMIIVRGNGHCSLFRFMWFTEEGFSYADEYNVFHVLSANDIERIDYEIRKSDGALIITAYKGVIKETSSIQAFFDITTNLKPYVHESALSGDPDWMNEAREEYWQKNDDHHVDIETTIVLKNGLTMALTYQPNLGTGYISGHYFLSEADNEIMRKMFGQ
ncbi:MAG: hypothetical protein IKV85_07945 [Ruminococcus sp.]|nr:hypothetical protein [Ruminococcus sp.]